MSTNTTGNLGWVAEPDGRGTWAILSTCSLTIVLCCWSSVYPNIPSRSDGAFKRGLGKINLFLIGLLGPEFLLVIALGQWSSARTSFKLFPIDAEQLFHLVKAGYVPYPDLDMEDIKDKSKLDGLARMIASLQAAWFLINCIIRAAQHLFLTTLEITTLSFIIIFFFTSFCWRHKPQDISRSMILHTNTPIATIRSECRPRPEKEWHQTPLDFLSRNEWLCSRLWRYYVQILQYLHIPIFARPITKPYDRIPSDNFLRLDRIADSIFAPCMLLFACMFMFAWNFEFPTPTERLLWRIAAVYQVLFGSVGALICWYADVFILPKHVESVEKPPNKLFHRLAWKLRNIHPDRDPDLAVPLKVLLPNVLLSFLYCSSRVFILVEDLIGLRSLPESAFQTVSWSKYIPHW
ncbi:hypothetical protein N7448_009591 [Penicillium atrosanguineum]|nr:hypothetical protein N7448_009591 [Penicillium atrosanguineum]KAJ5142124.1 hypothetical protein N7526_003119 [Penicillium atrosanguineum]